MMVMKARFATVRALSNSVIKNIIVQRVISLREIIIGLFVRASDEENMSEECPGFDHARATGD